MSVSYLRLVREDEQAPPPEPEKVDGRTLPRARPLPHQKANAVRALKEKLAAGQQLTEDDYKAEGDLLQVGPRAVYNWLRDDLAREGTEPEPCLQAVHDRFLVCKNCGYYERADGTHVWPAGKRFEITEAMWPEFLGRTVYDAKLRIMGKLVRDVSYDTVLRAHDRLAAHMRANRDGDVTATDNVEISALRGRDHLEGNDVWTVDFWHGRAKVLGDDGDEHDLNVAFLKAYSSDFIFGFAACIGEPTHADANAVTAQALEGFYVDGNFIGGVPGRIHADNGGPFKYLFHEAGGHARFRVENGMPKNAHPRGRHERTHRTARAEALGTPSSASKRGTDRYDKRYDIDIPAGRLAATVERIGRWIYSHNYELAQDRLGNKTPYAKLIEEYERNPPRRVSPDSLPWLARRQSHPQPLGNAGFEHQWRHYTHQDVMSLPAGPFGVASYDHDPTRLEIFDAEFTRHLLTVTCDQVLPEQHRQSMVYRRNRRDRSKRDDHIESARREWILTGNHRRVDPDLNPNLAEAQAADADDTSPVIPQPVGTATHASLDTPAPSSEQPAAAGTQPADADADANATQPDAGTPDDISSTSTTRTAPAPASTGTAGPAPWRREPRGAQAGPVIDVPPTAEPTPGPAPAHAATAPSVSPSEPATDAGPATAAATAADNTPAWRRPRRDLR